MSNDSAQGQQARVRGGLAVGLDRDLIVRAAREIPSAQLSMQAVADRLGVDRKALNYHVKGRDGLLELVASDVFQTYFSRVRIPRDDWRAACESFALGMAEALSETGELINYFIVDAVSLQAVEDVLETFEAAGFEDETAKRGLIHLTTLAMGAARDRVLTSRFGEHPQDKEIRRALTEASHSGAFPLLVGPALRVHDESQLKASVEIFILGMEQKLLG